jgi:SAM-dependent methyltransferase
MWGALTLPLARTGCSVVGIEQTRESLALLKQRVKEEHLDNVELVCADLNQIVFRENSIDAVVVNGVLEWIPSAESIELKKYYGKKGSSTRDPVRSRPDAMQQQFLGRIRQGLKPGGCLYLAIENRHDIFYFFGEPDPHCDLKFVTFLPRPLQDVVSRILLGRPYVNWIYSPEALRELLAKAGFSSVDVFYAFPDYRFPDYVLSEHGMDLYRPFRYATARSRIKKIGCYLVESIVFQRLKLHGFAPALIAIARK